MSGITGLRVISATGQFSFNLFYLKHFLPYRVRTVWHVLWKVNVLWWRSDQMLNVHLIYKRIIVYISVSLYILQILYIQYLFDCTLNLLWTYLTLFFAVWGLILSYLFWYCVLTASSLQMFITISIYIYLHLVGGPGRQLLCLCVSVKVIIMSVF